MKRTTLMAALTGAAVLLVGCSSTSGTAAPASTSSAAVTSSSVMSSSAMSSGMASASQAPSSAAPASTAAGITEPSSPAASGPAASSEAPTSSDDSSSGTVSSSASSSKAPTTVGNTSGGLDVESAAWFSTFCGGLQPVADIAKDAGSLGSSDQAAAQKTLVSLYSKIGSSFTATAAKLKPLPAPTFSGGEAFATKVVAALGSSGPTFSANAKKLAAIDVKKNPSAFGKALEGVTKDLGAATGPLQDLNSLKLTPQTQAAYEKLPACAKLKAGATG
jgi:hypothetical protein